MGNYLEVSKFLLLPTHSLWVQTRGEVASCSSFKHLSKKRWNIWQFRNTILWPWILDTVLPFLSVYPKPDISYKDLMWTNRFTDCYPSLPAGWAGWLTTYFYQDFSQDSLIPHRLQLTFNSIFQRSDYVANFRSMKFHLLLLNCLLYLLSIFAFFSTYEC